MTDMHSLTGVYALNALERDEAEDFERHLEHCSTCRGEVQGLQMTAAKLGAAAAIKAPASMREAVLLAVASTRQRPRSRRHAPATWHQRTAVVVAAAAVVAVGVIGSVAVVEHHRASEHSVAEQQASAIASVLAAPDARLVSAAMSAGGQMTMVVSATHGQAVVTMIGAPRLPSTSTYQLWVMPASGTPRSAGLSEGSGQVLVTDVTPTDQIGVTVEPVGGSSAPTTNPLAVMSA